MTGSQYATLYRWPIDDLRELAEVQLDGARHVLGRDPNATRHLRRASKESAPSAKRRHYIAAFREARFEIEGIPSANSLFEIVTPKDIKNELEALRGSYEIVNQTAKGRPDWDAHYREFQEYYKKNKDPGWLSSTYATVKNVRARAQRLEEWKDQLTAEGVKIREPQKKTAPNANPIKDTLDSATIMLLVGVGAVLLLKR